LPPRTATASKILDKREGKWSRTQGQDIVTNWLSSGLKFDAVVSNNDEMAIGAINALKAAKKWTPDFMVAGIDATPDALASMKAGDLKVTVFQNGAGQGTGAVDTAIKMIKKQPVEKFVNIPFELVTPANLSKYAARTDASAARCFASEAPRRSAQRMSEAATIELAQAASSAVATPLLEIAGIVKAFPGVVALDHVGFRLHAGTVHALMGENGAGKSTLMKIIAGIYTPDEGIVHVKGKPVVMRGPLDALNNGIAMIHQELNLMAFMTVAENIWIRREPITRFGLVDHGELRRRTQALFDRLAIGHRPGDRGTPAFNRQPPDGRDRQGGVLRLRRAHHG